MKNERKKNNEIVRFRSARIKIKFRVLKNTYTDSFRTLTHSEIMMMIRISSLFFSFYFILLSFFFIPKVLCYGFFVCWISRGFLSILQGIHSHKVCISTAFKQQARSKNRSKFISFHLNGAFRVLMLLYQFVFVFVILVAIHFDWILLIFWPLEFSCRIKNYRMKNQHILLIRYSFWPFDIRIFIWALFSFCSVPFRSVRAYFCMHEPSFVDFIRVETQYTARPFLVELNQHTETFITDTRHTQRTHSVLKLNQVKNMQSVSRTCRLQRLQVKNIHVG